jgi:adenylate kinase
MLNIVLFGPPGAGKGTQSEKLIAKYNLIHLSTGDLLREQIEAKTPLGLAAKAVMDGGSLVSDDIVIGMIAHKLTEHHAANGFIFDGFPRTVAQATALDNLLAQHQTTITKMLSLEVPEQELTKRLLLRGKNSGRPDDQNQEIIRNRVQQYYKNTLPVADYYTLQNKCTKIHGTGSIEDIFTKLCAEID